MKKKVKIITSLSVLVLTVGVIFAINHQARANEIPEDTCSHWVPRYNACLWHPVNCLCPIVVKE